MQLAEVMQKNLKRTVNIFEPCSTAAESLIVFSSEYLLFGYLTRSDSKIFKKKVLKKFKKAKKKFKKLDFQKS